MNPFKHFLSGLAILSVAIVFNACEENPIPTAPETQKVLTLKKWSLPADATLISATFNIHLSIANDQTVNVHRITSDWEEGVVTWGNFGSGYDGTIRGSFATGTADEVWLSAEITSLVQDWLNGTHPNYGLLLDQAEMNFPRAEFYNRENVGNYPPYLRIEYTTNGGESEYIELLAIADTHIYETFPDLNLGSFPSLATGWGFPGDKEMQSLIKFDIEPTLFVECTRPPIYWQKHTQYGPGNRDSHWDLIQPNGENSEFFLSGYNYYEVFGTLENSYYLLARQYIAVKINVLSGASIPTEIQNVFDNATGLFNTYTPEEIDNLRFWHPVRAQFRIYTYKLALYNWGIVGPGTCGGN